MGLVPKKRYGPYFGGQNYFKETMFNSPRLVCAKIRSTLIITMESGEFDVLSDDPVSSLHLVVITGANVAS